MTSVHPRYDTRIFLKECQSLVNNNYDVHLIVADGAGNECKNEVSIHDVGGSKSRIDRWLRVRKDVFRKAVTLDGDIYHFHDPELISIGIKLKKLGKCVIFDSHEDFSKQLLSKPYLNFLVAKLASFYFKLYESLLTPRFDAIICATNSIGLNFSRKCKKVSIINNYPILGELTTVSKNNKREAKIAYVGGVSRIRGIENVVEAFKYVNGAELNLVGSFSEVKTHMNVMSLSSWDRVIELGYLDRKNVASVLNSSIAGIVTFLPYPNHIEAQPNKMFEYMSAGIPVIASNFPLWRQIIIGNECGLCVDPDSPKEIAVAIQYLVDNPEVAQKMGKNGFDAVNRIYNWNQEESKLIRLYRELI
ncbi:glycosyltransferase family 4 protein [Vibrio sp. VB16]|uniref:glycosyltransferase family 4 protein n=1 Tax=Vibrio sp. VB16 TaxID=2785746 RepID=UPI00189DD092|nr:glycosyltransferase family 4 protein [Vibrio sp. VB16]UGA54987.1 glycosyltransferase family 4 protein [Vibrio sp. VB16]